MPVSKQVIGQSKQTGPEPYWSKPGATLYLGHVCVRLRDLPARSVHCVVTSPPYWGLRDYGVCECATFISSYDSPTSTLAGGGNIGKKQADPDCTKCSGTGRVMTSDDQIGAEPSADCDTKGQAQCGACFVCSMVKVFRELYRVLRDDGTVWLNLGDTYSEGNQLTGVPWRVALALQADGWILRQDIIWGKPNPMPESVTSRCTKSHEYIFLLAKSKEYYFDNVAIEEPSVGKWNSMDTFGTPNPKANFLTPAQLDLQRTKFADNTHHDDVEKTNRNKRSVWTVPTKPYPGAHFAVFSEQLITPCILAGTSEHGACVECGTPYERIVSKIGGKSADGDIERRDRSFEWSRNGKPGSESTLDGVPATNNTVGWRKVCGCQTTEVTPCVVLDPFVGSGTTVATSIQLGRACIGIDLNETYLRENAIPHIEAAMRGEKIRRKATVVVLPDTPPAPRKLRG